MHHIRKKAGCGYMPQFPSKQIRYRYTGTCCKPIPYIQLRNQCFQLHVIL